MARKPLFSSRNLVIFLILSVVFFFFVHRVINRSHDHLEKFASMFCYPVLVFQQKVIAPIKTSIFQHKAFHELQQELYATKKERDDLQAEIILLKATDTYDTAVQEVAAFKKRYDCSFGLIAQVLERRFFKHEHVYFIDVGARQGIKQDMVVVYKNCLVGRIDQVYAWYSRVRLITDKSCKVAAYCAQTGVRGIHQGFNNKYQSILSFVSHLDTITIGDRVISSGEGLVFPQGFALGKIGSVKSDGLYKGITVEPLVDLDSLEYCMVIAKSELNEFLEKKTDC